MNALLKRAALPVLLLTAVVFAILLLAVSLVGCTTPPRPAASCPVRTLPIPGPIGAADCVVPNPIPK